MEIFEEVLSPVFHEANWMENVAIGGNVQARLRGMTLMSISNRFGWLLLSTGNKDLYKTQVYELAKWRNKKSEVIPKRSITKAPSAELAPGQKDQDQLPPYHVLDKILFHHIEGRRSAKEIIAKGFSKKVVEKVLKMVRISEYKRRQSCPGVKLSPMMFGRDRRFPLTNKF
jgi:NH3-dependent NAD+ synthetase